MFDEAIETYCCQRGRMMGLELFQDMLIKLFWKQQQKHEKTFYKTRKKTNRTKPNNT